jgi:2-polyprenyl-3-methyl-5-hydroxy-6-metoxy-1,4-benzoquinol methylase
MLPASVSLRAGDLDDRLVAAAARANPDVPVRRESVYQLPHAGGAFDLVFCLEVLEHMDDPAAALSELCRVCRRYLVLSVPREPLWRVLNMARLKYLSRLGATPGHIQSWSRGGFVRWAGRSCRVLDVRNPVPFTIVLAEANHPKDRP